MKTHFEHVLFTHESRVTIWMDEWLASDGISPQNKITRQQGDGGVIIWTGIMGDQVVGPFRVPGGVTILTWYF